MGRAPQASCPALGPTDPLAAPGPLGPERETSRSEKAGQASKRAGRGWKEAPGVWIHQAWVQQGKPWGAGVHQGCRNGLSHREQGWGWTGRATA